MEQHRTEQLGENPGNEVEDRGDPTKTVLFRAVFYFL